MIFAVSSFTIVAPAAKVPIELPNEERTKTKRTRVILFE